MALRLVMAPAGLSPSGDCTGLLYEIRPTGLWLIIKKGQETCTNNRVQCRECFDFLVPLNIFTGFSSAEVVATPSTEGINKLLTYQNERGGLIADFVILPFVIFFSFFDRF